MTGNSKIISSSAIALGVGTNIKSSSTPLNINTLQKAYTELSYDYTYYNSDWVYNSLGSRLNRKRSIVQLVLGL